MVVKKWIWAAAVLCMVAMMGCGESQPIKKEFKIIPFGR